MTDPDQIMVDFEKKLGDIQQRGEQVRDGLAEEIMRTLRRAQSKLSGAAREAMPNLAGTESMAELDRQYRSMFPEVSPEPTRRRTLRLGAEGDFDDRDLLR